MVDRADKEVNRSPLTSDPTLRELDLMLEVVVVMLVGVVELVMVVMEVVLDKEVGKNVVVGVGQSVNDQGR